MMDRSLKFLAGVAIAGAAYSVGLSAQVVTYGISGQAGPGPDAASIGIAAGKMIHFAGDVERVVKGAPFSAQAVTTTTQVLGDGNRIVQTSETSLARDGEGRSRRELSIDKIGPWSTDATGRLVIIRDPVAGVSYQLSPDGQHAMKTPMAVPDTDSDTAQRGMKAKHEAELRAAHLKQEVGATTTATRAFSFRTEGGGVPGELSMIIGDMDEGPAKKESLGEQNIEGVRAQGTRETRTIAAGKIGNERPIEIVSETWYAPDLQMVVQSRHSDPRAGETVYRLTNISLGEPDATLFQLPAGVTVDDMSQMKFRMERQMLDKPRAEHPELPQPW